MASSKPKKDAEGQKRVVATNRRARHEYEILETLEAGLVLTGSEVKSLRDGKASIAEAHARIEKGEAWLIGMSVPEYGDATYNNHRTDRKRKLLLSRQELSKWHKKVTQKGLTLVPLELYFGPRGYVKVQIALVRGRQAHDRREAIKKRETEREIRRHHR